MWEIWQGYVIDMYMYERGTEMIRRDDGAGRNDPRLYHKYLLLHNNPLYITNNLLRTTRHHAFLFRDFLFIPVTSSP